MRSTGMIVEPPLVWPVRAVVVAAEVLVGSPEVEVGLLEPAGPVEDVLDGVPEPAVDDWVEVEPPEFGAPAPLVTGAAAPDDVVVPAVPAPEPLAGVEEPGAVAVPVVVAEPDVVAVPVVVPVAVVVAPPVTGALPPPVIVLVGAGAVPPVPVAVEVRPVPAR